MCIASESYVFRVVHLRVGRTSGVCDHYAQDDAHAIHLARNIVANLNWKETSNVRFACVAPLLIFLM